MPAAQAKCPSYAAMVAAIDTERAVRAAGALLFLDVDNGLYVLYPHKLTPSLTQLCREQHAAITWLLRARSAP